MRKTVCFLVASGLVAVCACQEIPEYEYTLEAKAVTESGAPLSGIKVITGRLEMAQVEPIPISNPVTTDPVLTDQRGIAVIAFKSVPEPSGNVTFFQDGYYNSRERVQWTSRGNGASREYSAKVTSTVKAVKNPIPMFAWKDLRIRTPEFGVAYGFDLSMGQALPPFGNGMVADVEFVLSGTRTEAPEPTREAIDFRMEVRCPNDGDGFVEFLVPDTTEFRGGSELPSDHEAPKDGYQNRLFRVAATDRNGDMGNVIRENSSNRNKCYYFRLRTRRDEEGKIVSAHYGKIYGPLEIRPAWTRHGHDVSKGQGGFFIQYLYFNPTPNDRNVEFDPKRNINPDSRVTRP